GSGVRSILVTGASGFVGRAVCERALSLGFKVRGSHRLSASADRVPSGVERIQVASLGSNTDWAHALAGVDAVIHLAARVHAMNESLAEPLPAYRQVNTAGTEQLARMAARAGVARMIYVSTVKVNGEETFAMPFTEADPPRPQDPYAVSKWES